MGEVCSVWRSSLLFGEAPCCLVELPNACRSHMLCEGLTKSGGGGEVP